jgi:hypothetical protein
MSPKSSAGVVASFIVFCPHFSQESIEVTCLVHGINPDLISIYGFEGG